MNADTELLNRKVPTSAIDENFIVIFNSMLYYRGSVLGRGDNLKVDNNYNIVMSVIDL